jgi:hypothetical protein
LDGADGGEKGRFEKLKIDRENISKICKKRKVNSENKHSGIKIEAKIQKHKGKGITAN